MRTGIGMTTFSLLCLVILSMAIIQDLQSLRRFAPAPFTQGSQGDAVFTPPCLLPIGNSPRLATPQAAYAASVSLRLGHGAALTFTPAPPLRYLRGAPLRGNNLILARRFFCGAIHNIHGTARRPSPTSFFAHTPSPQQKNTQKANAFCVFTAVDIRRVR